MVEFSTTQPLLRFWLTAPWDWGAVKFSMVRYSMVTSVPAPSMAKSFSSWPSRTAPGPPISLSLLAASMWSYSPEPRVWVPGANQ